MACLGKAGCRSSEKVADSEYNLMIEPTGLAYELEERSQDSQPEFWPEQPDEQ